MPILSAVLYPVYMYQMQPAWAEWTRLMELPFVACELAIIHVAIARGYHDGSIWRMLPRDIKIALVLLGIGLTTSSVFVSRNVPASITLSIITLIHLRFAAAMFFLAQRERAARLESFFLWLGVGLVALTLLTALKFHFPPPESAVPGGQIHWPSALPGFINVRHFGSWTGAIAAGLMVALLYGRQKERGTTQLFYLLATGLTCWSGTRAAILAMGMVAVIALASMRRLPNGRSLTQIAGLSALALFGAVLLSPDLPEFALFLRDNLQSADAITSGRTRLWHDTFYRWLDSPIFGWGSGSTFWEVNIGWSHTQPHNAVLQFLISWGVVGAAGGLWLLGRAIVAIHPTGMGDERLRPLAGMTYSLLFMSLLEGMLHYPRFIMAIMIGFAVLLAARQQEGAMGRHSALDD
ncbi:O-antigen ligase [Sphingomonas sp. TZW2008]|uniref:O-antigen ligase family protein n=1 Tax=Sphingomonas sp. TZW2008 TaxID=1917973 RepID=UPI000A26E9EE|nr:O-antigen ligase family protein [Sphingomonas sp. TZW2008]